MSAAKRFQNLVWNNSILKAVYFLVTLWRGLIHYGERVRKLVTHWAGRQQHKPFVWGCFSHHTNYSPTVTVLLFFLPCTNTQFLLCQMFHHVHQLSVEFLYHLVLGRTNNGFLFILFFSQFPSLPVSNTDASSEPRQDHKTKKRSVKGAEGHCRVPG